MSRIFAIVTLATALVAGTGVITVAYQGSGADSSQLDSIASLFASGIELSALLPIAMAAGLVLASLGVLARA